jgi:AraC-like DNA-binding protein
MPGDVSIYAPANQKLLERTDSFLWERKGNELMTSRLDHIKDWALLAKSSRYSASVIARECGVSPRHLERYFQDRMKKTPHQWLRELRLSCARELLQKDVPIKQVAQELCYKDVAHFCRDFKAYFGSTPGAIAALPFVPTAASATSLHVAFRQ